jgi:hypothetical protein
VVNHSAVLTCITLSKEPFQHRLPSGIRYINEVSVFKSMACDYAARLRAIAKVRTTHFFFLDWDDEYHDMAYPSDNLTVGTEYRHTKDYCLPVQYQDYTPELHIRKPQLIHNATCVNTKAARRAIAQMPASGVYYFQLMFYHTLIRLGGFTYDERLKYTWTLHDSGYHTKAASAIENTKNYLRDIMHAP